MQLEDIVDTGSRYTSGDRRQVAKTAAGDKVQVATQQQGIGYR